MRNGLPAAFDFTLADSGVSDGVSEQIFQLWELYYKAVEEVAGAQLHSSGFKELRSTSLESSHVVRGMRDENGGNDSGRRSHGNVRFAGTTEVIGQSVANNRQHGTSIGDRHVSGTVSSQSDGVRNEERFLADGRSGVGPSGFIELPVSPRYKPSGFRWTEDMAIRGIRSWEIYYKTCLRIARNVLRYYNESQDLGLHERDRVSSRGTGFLSQDGEVADGVSVPVTKSVSFSDQDTNSSTGSDSSVHFDGRQPKQEVSSKSRTSRLLVPFCRDFDRARPVGRMVAYARDESPLTDDEKKNRLRTKRARKKNKKRGSVPSVHRPAYGSSESEKEFECLRSRSAASFGVNYEELRQQVKQKLLLDMASDVGFKSLPRS